MKSLSAKNLEALGAARLAELLMEISAGDAGARRRLRLSLAGISGPSDVAREVQKRLAILAKARAFVDWNKIRPLAEDLAAQHRAIMDVVAPVDPRQALDLLWRFMDLVDPIMTRCDDSQGRLGDIFRMAARDLAPLAKAARVEPESLAASILEAIRANDYGQFDGLIAAMAEPLGAAGLAALKRRLLDWGKEAPEAPPRDEWQVIGYGSRGAIHAHDIATRQSERAIKAALRDIADAEGDVDAFISLYDDAARRAPTVVVAIAGRLLTAGRPEEALRLIESADKARLGLVAHDLEQARVDALEALGRSDEAQAYRWSCFTSTLDERHLRAYLKRLPDFDDLEAEDRALDLAMAFPDIHGALAFLISWPALDRANEIVIKRFPEIDGDIYEILSPAASALEARYPLATTLIRRAMIDFTLNNARAGRYGHAARHLRECGALAPLIADFAPHASHDDYRRGLVVRHGRKAGFWQRVRSER
jgi:hypothetical protein